MIFNPVRSGGSEKEYMITAGNGIITSATKLKPGHVFEAHTNYSGRKPKMEFQDPDTGNKVTIKASDRASNFVMPCADVKLSFY